MGHLESGHSAPHRPVEVVPERPGQWADVNVTTHHPGERADYHLVGPSTPNRRLGVVVTRRRPAPSHATAPTRVQVVKRFASGDVIPGCAAVLSGSGDQCVPDQVPAPRRGRSRLLDPPMTPVELLITHNQ